MQSHARPSFGARLLSIGWLLAILTFEQADGQEAPGTGIEKADKDLAAQVYAVRHDEFLQWNEEKSSIQATLAAAGIEFPDGCSANYSADSELLTIHHTSSGLKKFEEWLQQNRAVMALQAGGQAVPAKALRNDEVIIRCLYQAKIAPTEIQNLPLGAGLRLLLNAAIKNSDETGGSWLQKLSVPSTITNPGPDISWKTAYPTNGYDALRKCAGEAGYHLDILHGEIRVRERNSVNLVVEGYPMTVAQFETLKSGHRDAQAILENAGFDFPVPHTAVDHSAAQNLLVFRHEAETAERIGAWLDQQIELLLTE